MRGKRSPRGWVRDDAGVKGKLDLNELFVSRAAFPRVGILFDGGQLFPVPLDRRQAFLCDLDLGVGLLCYELFLEIHQASLLQFGQLNGKISIAQACQPPQG